MVDHKGGRCGGGQYKSHQVDVVRGGNLSVMQQSADDTWDSGDGDVSGGATHPVGGDVSLLIY